MRSAHGTRRCIGEAPCRAGHDIAWLGLSKPGCGMRTDRQQVPSAGSDVPAMRATAASADPRLSDEERIDWLRLIRSENVGPRGIMVPTPQAHFRAVAQVYCVVEDPPHY